MTDDGPRLAVVGMGAALLAVAIAFGAFTTMAYFGAQRDIEMGKAGVDMAALECARKMSRQRERWCGEYVDAIGRRARMER